MDRSILGDPLSAGWEDQNLVTVAAPNGQSWRVHRLAAPAFTGLINELAANGYELGSSGGFNYRNIRGGNTLSEHAFGNAIDINAAANPMGGTTSDLPPNIGEIAAKYGLEWGGNWKNRPDPMHFEWTGPNGSGFASATDPRSALPSQYAPQPTPTGLLTTPMAQPDPMQGLSPLERMLAAGGFAQDAKSAPIANIWNALSGKRGPVTAQGQSGLGGLLKMLGA